MKYILRRNKRVNYRCAFRLFVLHSFKKINISRHVYLTEVTCVCKRCCCILTLEGRRLRREGKGKICAPSCHHHKIPLALALSSSYYRTQVHFSVMSIYALCQVPFDFLLMCSFRSQWGIHKNFSASFINAWEAPVEGSWWCYCSSPFYLPTRLFLLPLNNPKNKNILIKFTN